VIRPVRATDPRPPDPLARVLEIGLALVLFAAPLPFASVTPEGRLALEIAAGVLLAVWLVRGFTRGVVLPRWPVACGLFGLLAWTALQCIPLGSAAVDRIAPAGAALRGSAGEDPATRAAEERILGAPPESFDRPAAFSLDPPATASALRTGAALVALFLVALTVVTVRGPRLIAWALLASATFQGLYGMLVLASGHPVIWGTPKKFYVDCATGTFVNRNHFAGFLAMALPAGLAIALSHRPETASTQGLRARVLDLLGAESVRRLLAGLLVAIGTAGLLLSYSRAGIGLGVTALVATALLLRRGTQRRAVVVTLLLLAVAAVPLAQIGAERLAGRYTDVGEDLGLPGGRVVVWKDTARMFAAFPVTGVGFGAFPGAYPAFRSPNVRVRYDQAHNDYVQLAAEGGLVALGFLASALVPLTKALLRGLSGALGPLGVGLAAGASVALLHALVDFNLHIPANAATAAVLAGAVAAEAWKRG